MLRPVLLAVLQKQYCLFFLFVLKLSILTVFS